MGSELFNPESGIKSVFIDYVNTDSVAHAHGHLVVKDTSSDADAIIDAGILSAGNASSQVGVMGVVWDPTGNGVAVGDRGTLMVRGYHPAVKHDATSTSRGNVLVSSNATAGYVEPNGGTVAVGGQVGLAAADYASGNTIKAFIDIK